MRAESLQLIGAGIFKWATGRKREGQGPVSTRHNVRYFRAQDTPLPCCSARGLTKKHRPWVPKVLCTPRIHFRRPRFKPTLLIRKYWGVPVIHFAAYDQENDSLVRAEWITTAHRRTRPNVCSSFFVLFFQTTGVSTPAPPQTWCNVSSSLSP